MVADTYSTDGVGVLLMGTGNDNNTWGANANSFVFQILVDALTNLLTSSVTGGTLDLSGSPPPAAASQARYAGLKFTGVLSSNQVVQVPNLNKWWLVCNATSGSFTLKFKTSGGSASTAIPQNSGWQLVRCDGSNVIEVWPFNTAQIQMPDGTISLPSYSWLNDSASGWRRAGTQDYRMTINGVDVIQMTGSGASSPSIVAIGAGQTFQVNALQILSTDAGAALDPTLDLYRDSATPAASDFLGKVDFNGRDSAANKETYARIFAQILDATSTSEDAILVLQQIVAGVLTTILTGTSGGGISIPGALAVTGTTSLTGVLSLLATDRMAMAKGTTGQRPGSPAAGDVRFNTTTGFLEYHDGSSWNSLGLATTTVAGIVLGASQATMEAESTVPIVVTPDMAHFAPSAIKAWGIFTGSTGALAASYNITSVAHNGTGDWTVTIATDFSNASYVIVATAYANGLPNRFMNVYAKAAGTFSLFCTSDAGGSFDPTSVMFICVGDQ